MHGLIIIGGGPSSDSQEVCDLSANPAYNICTSADRLEPDYEYIVATPCITSNPLQRQEKQLL